MISLSLGDLKLMKDFFPQYLCDLMTGSRTLLAKVCQTQIMFIEQLVRANKDSHSYDVHENQAFKVLTHHAMRSQLFNMMINQMEKERKSMRQKSFKV